jgi:hypothetical protein
MATHPWRAWQTLLRSNSCMGSSRAMGRRSRNRACHPYLRVPWHNLYCVLAQEEQEQEAMLVKCCKNEVARSDVPFTGGVWRGIDNVRGDTRCRCVAS